MPAKRSAMQKITEVLRLKFEARLSHERIGAVIPGLLIDEHATIQVYTADPKQALYARQLTILVLSHIDRTWCNLAQRTNQ